MASNNTQSSYECGDEDDFQEFCDHFKFYDSVSRIEEIMDSQGFECNLQFQDNCFICNGFYGPSFSEPICGVCHSFVFQFEGQVEIENLTTQFSDEEDSGNEEMAGNDQEQQELDDNSEAESVNLNFDMNRQLNVDPPRGVADFIDLLSRPRPEQEQALIKDEIVESLPVEILIKIFSYLDDLSLWTVSEVCRKWKTILERNTTQNFWKRYLRERFPLFQQISSVTNWMDLYCSMMSSCFCRICLIQMANKIPIRNERVNHLRSRRLRNDIRSIAQEGSSGIDGKLCIIHKIILENFNIFRINFSTSTRPTRDALAGQHNWTTKFTIRRRKILFVHSISI